MATTKLKDCIESSQSVSVPLIGDRGMRHWEDFTPRTDPIVEEAFPTQILIGALRDGRLRVYKPFRVKFAKGKENLLAEAPVFNEFGFGGSPSEALADLQHSIAELFFTLESEQDRLGVDLERVWDALQKYIRRR